MEERVDVEELLEEALKDKFNELSSLQTGSEETMRTVSQIERLYKLRIEETKSEKDCNDRHYRRLMEDEHHREEMEFKEKQRLDEIEAKEREERSKQEQLANEKKHQYIRLGVDLVGIVLPIVFYAKWMRKGFKFEETGTFTSQTFRNLFNRFRPTK